MKRPTMAIVADEMFTKRDREDFWARVDQSGDCWLWTAGKTTTGYGILRVSLADSRRALAHRVAYALTHGRCDADIQVCHTCDTPACCKPDHLYAGTPQLNALDMVARGRTNPNTPPEIQAAIILMSRRGMPATRIARWFTMHYITVARIAREAGAQ